MDSRWSRVFSRTKRSGYGGHSYLSRYSSYDTNPPTQGNWWDPSQEHKWLCMLPSPGSHFFSSLFSADLHFSLFCPCDSWHHCFVSDLCTTDEWWLSVSLPVVTQRSDFQVSLHQVHLLSDLLMPSELVRGSVPCWNPRRFSLIHKAFCSVLLLLPAAAQSCLLLAAVRGVIPSYWITPLIGLELFKG